MCYCGSMRLTSLVLLAVLGAGCSKGGLSSDTDGGVEDGGNGGADMAMNIACTCPAGEGCLRATVTRSADASQQPWLVWPAMADGCRQNGSRAPRLILTTPIMAAPKSPRRGTTSSYSKKNERPPTACGQWGCGRHKPAPYTRSWRIGA